MNTTPEQIADLTKAHTDAHQDLLDFANTLQTRLTELEAKVSPVGSVNAFAGNTPPNGWFECNGIALSRVDYADLFNAIGVTYGAGDGSTTFNLPDLRGEFVRGWDHERGADDERILGTWQAPSLVTASIGPDVIQDLVIEGSGANAATVADFNKGMQTDNIADSDYATTLKGNHYVASNHAYTGNSSGKAVDGNANRPLNVNPYFAAGGARPRNLALMYCIKY